MRVALLGTGIMGRGMARSMRRAGLEVTAWNRTRAHAEPLADDGVQIADSVGDAISGAEVVITMLFDTESVLDVAAEITAAIGPDAPWLQCSTVGPDGITRIAEAAGVGTLVDAPVLGTKKPADDGTLTMLVSGPPAAIETAGPVLDAVGARTVVAGERIGAASALKLACNAYIATTTAAVGQSLALARRLGLDGAQVLDALSGAAADSPYLQAKGKAVLAGDFTTSFTVDGVRKDLGLIRAAGAGVDLPTGLVDAVLASYDAASAQGHGDEDMAAVATAF